MEQTFKLPFPVPLHACFIKSKGGSGIPSKRYKAYRANAIQMLQEQGVALMAGPVSVSFVFVAPDKRKRDADNLMKCLFDNLSGVVIEDDNNQIVRACDWRWEAAGSPCTVTVRGCVNG